MLRLDNSGGGLNFTATPGPVPQGGEPLANGAPALPALPWLLLAALAGGVLLNVMPLRLPRSSASRR